MSYLERAIRKGANGLDVFSKKDGTLGILATRDDAAFALTSESDTDQQLLQEIKAVRKSGRISAGVFKYRVNVEPYRTHFDKLPAWNISFTRLAGNAVTPTEERCIEIQQRLGKKGYWYRLNDKWKTALSSAFDRVHDAIFEGRLSHAKKALRELEKLVKPVFAHRAIDPKHPVLKSKTGPRV